MLALLEFYLALVQVFRFSEPSLLDNISFILLGIVITFYILFVFEILSQKIRSYESCHGICYIDQANFKVLYIIANTAPELL